MVTKGVRTAAAGLATAAAADNVVNARALALAAAVCPVFWLINDERGRACEMILRTMSFM